MPPSGPYRRRTWPRVERDALVGYPDTVLGLAQQEQPPHEAGALSIEYSALARESTAQLSQVQ